MTGVREGRTDPSTATAEDPVRIEVNPFPGPRAYRGDQEHQFFGRAEEIEELASLLLSTSATLLYAPSGTGKSSLLHAGLAPYLEHHFDFVLLPTVHVGRGSRTEPDRGGTNQFVRLVCEAISDGAEPVGEDIAAAARSRRPDGMRRELLILDQFEEVFDDPALWRDREEFFAELTRALVDNTWLRVIIALRSDYLADLVPYERYLPNNLVVRYQLECLTDEQAQQAISCAFAASDVDLPGAVLDDLLDALLEEAPGPGRPAPMRAQHVNTVQLQIACRRLWEELKDGVRATPRPGLSRDMSSLRSSMTSFVDEAIAEVVGHDRAEEAAVRWWLDEYLITPAGRRAFVLVGEEETAGLPNALVRALEEVRLVQIEQRHGSRLVELTHDSMVEGVRASNEARERLRYRRMWRRRVVLAALLVALLALFPFLLIDRVNSEEFSGTTATDGVRHPVPGQADGLLVEIYPVSQPLTLRIVEDTPGPDDRTLVEQAVPTGQTTTSIAARTDPDLTYVVEVTSSFPGVDYTFAVTASPAMSPQDLERGSISSTRVVLETEPDRLELVRVDDGELAGVAGAGPLVLDRLSDFAVIDGSGAVALLLEAAPTAATVRRQVLDRSDQLLVGQSRNLFVAPSAIDYVPLESTQLTAGVEIRCTELIEVQVVGGSPPAVADGFPLTTTVGPEGTVLPVFPGPAASGVVLHNYYAVGPADCRVDLQQRQEATVSSFGRNDLVVPASASSAAFPITLPRDAVLVADPSAAVAASMYCGAEPADSLVSSTGRFLAVAPTGSSCVLWLVKSVPSPGPTSVAVWIAEGSDPGGR